MKMDVGSTINEKLTMTQREFFWMTYIGLFLRLKEIRFSTILMHVVVKVTERELWFKIKDVEVFLSSVEFALTIGLVFEDNTDVSHYVDISERLRLKEEYF